MDRHTGVHTVEPVVDCVDEVREIRSATLLEGVRHRSAQELNRSPDILGLMAVAVEVDSPSNNIELISCPQ